MYTVFLVCAVVGGTILVFQVILLLLGGGGGEDVEFSDIDVADPSDLDVGGVGMEADVDPSMPHAHGAGGSAEGVGLTVISLKTLVAFVTFFGLGGLEALRRELHAGWAVLIAIGAGTVALYIVAYLWYLLSKLGSSGNIKVRSAIGRTGSVYLRIPGGGDGKGKVTLTVQGRTLEWDAITEGDEIPTGRSVKVVGVILPGTLRVEEAS